MKWILIPLLWTVAVVVALAVIWRMWHGRNVVLRGRWSPRFVRMVVLVLIVVGVGIDKASSEPPPEAGRRGVPRVRHVALASSGVLTSQAVTRWRHGNARLGPWQTVKQAIVTLDATAASPDSQTIETIRVGTSLLPEQFRELLLADVNAIEKGQPIPTVDAAKLIATLDEMERFGFCDHWSVAYLWRKSARLTSPGDRTRLAELFVRIERHARMTDALIYAQVAVRPTPISPRAWMSKAGPSREIRLHEEQIQQRILAAAQGYFSTHQATTWQRDATMVAAVGDGSVPVTIVRPDGRHELRPGQTFTFTRLDLLETSPGEKPVVLRHLWLGQIELLAGRTLSVWDLPALISPEAKKKLQSVVEKAVAGDELAAEQLQRALPLTHEAIRIAVEETPRAKGAPRLRMLLTLFDDTVVRDRPPQSPVTRGDFLLPGMER